MTSATSSTLENQDELMSLKGQADAIRRSLAVIEFELDGTILDANENFLNTVGYTLDEIRGQHHSMFVDPAYRESAEYREFWRSLAAGEYQAAEYCRFGKAGKPIWIQASYNPIFDDDGKPVRVIKFATDITESKSRNADFEGQIDAINRVMATIEFDLDGTINTANDNFLATVGYDLEEIQGRHHSVFVTPEERNSADYQRFWEELAAGHAKSGEFKRVAKDGSEIWIQASYNPIFDAGGNPVKVVKFATDITEAKVKNASFEGQIDAIGKAMATIEFELDGTIRTANDNFLAAVGYELQAIQGRHHSMFVDPEERDSAEYRQFWEDLAAGRPQSGEFRRVSKSGDEIWIQASYNPIFDVCGRPFKIVKFATDITEAVRDRIVNTRYASMVDGLPIAAMFVDRDLNLQYMNRESSTRLRELREYLPIPPEQIVGSNIDIFHKDPSHQRNLLADPKKLPIQTHIQLGPETLDLLVSPVHDPDGNHLGSMATWSVITESLRIERNVASSAQSLAGASEELTATSQNMAANAEETAAQASTVSAAAEQVSHNIQTVATGAEELEASIREIAKNAADAANVATRAVEVATDTNQTVNKLGDSSAEIGQVVKVITSIAQQTNLLALNATIEAARAGEAGKGFAVVANEVKELAKQTAQATEEIGQKIGAIQTDTGGAVEAIREITDVIQRINDIQSTIASAVEEQTATTNEIGRNISEAARGSTEIAETITGVAEAARSVSEGATETQRASSELSELASGLQGLVDGKH